MTKNREQKKWLIDLTAPLDEELFIEMLGVFANASTPGASQTKALGLDDIMKMGRDDITSGNPMAVGMQAVTKALSEKGVAYKQGYIARIGSIAQITNNSEEFAEFMDEPDPETGDRAVSEALIRAAAVCKFRISMKGVGYDLKDVAMRAKENMEGAALV